MAAYPKATPQLSHAVIHGNSSRTPAIGLAVMNTTDEFVSLVGELNKHNQPRDAGEATIRVGQLPRRAGDEGIADNALGIVLLDTEDGGNPVPVGSTSVVPDNCGYVRMILRTANEYDVRFRNA